ncbi:transcriptional regulator [Kyrpidia spormannii]|uniref:Transcriptional regulator n=2 Tax=Kyrpidia spormannii TaxID=2055160 RepID=A0A2K8N2M1_9BACL|nr:transcriptional regulator [Kyrpidia spormannii]
MAEGNMKKSRMFWLSLAVVLALGGTFGLGYWQGARSARGDLQAQSPGGGSTPVEAAAAPMHVLLIGYDARPGQNYGNTDTLIVASFDPQSKRLAMLSVPRDTRVAIPGHGYDKINAAMNLGGVKLTEQMVSSLVGVSLDHYVRVNFEQFKGVIDALGGVTVNVDKNMYYVTGDAQDGVINLHKGVQHLNGDQALQFVRYRQDPLGDITRTQRQQELLKALADQALQPSTIVKLPVLIPRVMQAVDTDFSLLDVLRLTRMAGGMSGQQVISETLPGQFLNLNGVSYWQVDPGQAKQVMAELDEGKRVSQVVESPGAGSGSSTTGGSSAPGGGTGGSPGTDGSSGASGSTSASGSSSGGSQTPTATVLGQNVHVRSGPGTNYRIIGSVAGGETVTLIQQNGDWWLVMTPDGMRGYMSAAWLRVD